MRQLAKSIYFYLLVLFIGTSCANQQPPDGGPKDTIPPTVLYSNPIHQSTSVISKTFYFELDERVNVDKLKKELLIVPSTEIKYKVNYKKNNFDITFEEPLDSATTYTFNFLNGVTDVTEKNPVKNFKFVFSTGAILDSLSINGTVTNASTAKPVENALVVLLRDQDTTSIFESKPYYFTYTDEEGHFLIENIKNNSYNLFAYIDLNKNLTCDAEEEPIAQFGPTLDLNSNIDSIKLPLVYQDNRILKFIRANKKGKYFRVAYNKPIKEYHILNDSTTNFTSHLLKEKDVIRFYNTINLQDSLVLHLQAIDSLGNETIDTVSLQFDNASTRKPEPFEVKLTLEETFKLIDTLSFKIESNKPLSIINKDSMLISFDTLYEQTIRNENIIVSDDRTSVFVKQLVDFEAINALIDTLKTQTKLDTLITAEDSIIDAQHQYLDKLIPRTIGLRLKRGAVISIDQDTSKFLKKDFKVLSNEELGIISGSVTTEEDNYILQLINSKYLVIRELYNVKSFNMTQLPPGNYNFRIIIDKNGDRRWNKGNLYRKELPEEVIILTKEISLRANWELSAVDIVF